MFCILCFGVVYISLHILPIARFTKLFAVYVFMFKTRFDISYLLQTKMAEDILIHRQRILDLRECGSQLSSIQSKIQSMLNSNFTYRTIHTINNQIDRASVDFVVEEDTHKGIMYIVLS